MFDITASKEAELRLEHLAYHDSLTGLPNRAMFEEHLELALARARRDDLAVAALSWTSTISSRSTTPTSMRPETPCSGRWRAPFRGGPRHRSGRPAGGRRVPRADRHLARGGGGAPAGSTVDRVVERIEHELAIPYRLRIGEISLRASIGCGIYPFDDDEGAAILRHADASMYEQKRGKSDRPIPLRRLA